MTTTDASVCRQCGATCQKGYPLCAPCNRAGREARELEKAAQRTPAVLLRSRYRCRVHPLERVTWRGKGCTRCTGASQ